MKPHRGTIKGARKDVKIKGIKKAPYGDNLGYIIVGFWQGHPIFGFSFGQTSLVTKKGRWKNNQCEIETLNSRYTWEREAA